MARYGISLYGASFYGSPNLSAFSAAPVAATPEDYGTVLLTWTSPGGTWSELRVIRNYAGYPAAVNNGVQVYSVTLGQDAGRLMDSGLRTDRWVYYTVFVYDDNESEWLRSGVAKVFVPRDFGGSAKMLDLLPDVAKSDQLAGFMSVFGYAYDLLRNDINSALDLFDTQKVSYDLVPLLMEQLGIPIETELEPEQYRRFLRNAVYFYETKGTVPCIRGVVTAITGWQTSVVAGHNLLWTSDDSDFAASIGGWVPKVRSDADWLAPSGGTSGALRHLVISTGTSEVHLTERIPVSGHAIYSAAALVRAATVSQAGASIRFDWYDTSGSLISSNDGTTTPTRQTVDTAISTTATSPANAVSVDVVLVIHSGGGGFPMWYWRRIMINRGQPLPHESGRDVRIYVTVTDTDPLREQVHLSRLADVLPRYLPLGATYTVIAASAPAPTVSEDPVVTS